MWTADPRRIPPTSRWLDPLVGEARYVADLRVPDAFALAVVRSDLPHARIGRIEVGEALAAAGVHAVLTAFDLDPVPEIPIRVGPTPSLLSHLQPVLAREAVRYVGEPLAVVVADSEQRAVDGADLVSVDLEPVPALEPRGSGLSEVWDPPSENLLVEVEDGFGDLDAALDQATEVLVAESSTARRAGLPVEPRGLVARWEEGVLHLWGVTKFVGFTRRTIAGFFGLEPDAVVCHRVDVGGMFGVRGEVYPEDFLVPWAAQVTGRPVRWIESRRDHFRAVNQAGAQHYRIRIAIDGEGRLLGLDADVLIDAGAYPRPIGSRIPHIVVETLPGPYRWEACRVRCRSVRTNRTPTGTVRGPAALEATFAREHALDLVSRRAGRDPVDVRRSNLIPSSAIPHTLPFRDHHHRQVYDSGDFSAVFDAFTAAAGLPALLAERDRRQEAGELVGVGMACFVIHSGLGGEESVRVDLTDEGDFLVRTSAAEVGQGLDRTLRRLVAGALTVPEERVSVWSGDSEAHDGGNGTFSSRSALFAGSASLDAVAALAELARQAAGATLGCDPSDVRLSGGGADAEGGRVAWKELAPLSAVGRLRMEHPTYGFGIHLVLASIEPDTGEVRVERIATGYDCGRALDRAGVTDQIVGAAVMGLGAALREGLAYDADEVPLSGTLADYPAPRAPDVPPIQVEVFESAPAPGNPLGAKGAGEAGVIGMGGAVANAVADALGGGVGVPRLPVRPEDLMALIAGRTPG